MLMLCMLCVCEQIKTETDALTGNARVPPAWVGTIWLTLTCPWPTPGTLPNLIVFDKAV